uniref:Uncharacterized protein n=1 Tax=Brassica oleracea TaxID=3712 RepID=A0A3P6CTT6_BRAOL|nr:unnamed protein product [Brassica oleracea]
MPKLRVLLTFENKNCKQIQKTFSLSRKEKKTMRAAISVP